MTDDEDDRDGSGMTHERLWTMFARVYDARLFLHC